MPILDSGLLECYIGHESSCGLGEKTRFQLPRTASAVAK